MKRNKSIIAPGTRFSRLVVTNFEIRREGKSLFTKRYYRCVCDCGNVSMVPGFRLRAGVVKSCGCLARDNARQRMLRHGLSGTSTHNIWMSMLNRCNKPAVNVYRFYGGRGIRVCKRWHKFENFVKDMGLRPANLSIERRDNDGPYCKSNCYWATRKQQASNTRRNILVTLKGETMTASEAARRVGLAPCRVQWRLRNGWTLKRALQPVKRNSMHTLILLGKASPRKVPSLAC